MLRSDILKIRRSTLFISAILITFIVVILINLVSFLHAKNILSQMTVTSNELLLGYEGMLRMVVFTFNPVTSALSSIQAYLYFLPLIIPISYSFILNDEWENGTIKLENIYHNHNIYSLRIILGIVFTYLLLFINIGLNVVISSIIWTNLKSTHDVLTNIEIPSIEFQVIYLIIITMLITTVMYFVLMSSLTYGLKSNIPFIVLLLIDVTSNFNWDYSPFLIYKDILNNLLIKVEDVHIITHLLTSETSVSNELLDISVHPVLVVYMYTLIATISLFILIKKKRIT